jgi:hypothetical protein
VRNDQLGLDGLATAFSWIEKNDGAADARVRGILVPGAGVVGGVPERRSILIWRLCR